MRVNIIRQAVAQLAAIAANLVLLAPALEMLEPQCIHRVRIPDRLHGLDAHVANHQLRPQSRKHELTNPSAFTE